MGDLKTKEKKEELEKFDKFVLIEGVFTEPDAREVLANLIENKIRFHHLRIISTLDREGKVDRESEARIKELQITKDALLAMLSSSEIEPNRYVIKSEITFELVK